MPISTNAERTDIAARGSDLPSASATRPHHLPEAVDALGLELTDAEAEELEASYQQHGPSWY